jgi:hypothetical protein
MGFLWLFTIAMLSFLVSCDGMLVWGGMGCDAMLFSLDGDEDDGVGLDVME